MSIVKVNAVTIAGKIADFDRIVEEYVYGRDIHLENAMSVMTDRKGVYEFKETNPYDSITKSIGSLLELAGISDTGNALADADMSAEDMLIYIEKLNDVINEEKERDNELRKQIADNVSRMENLKPMLDANVDLRKLNDMEFVVTRFGHLPKSSYKTLTTYLDNSDCFFVPTAQDDADVWGFYFAPRKKQKRIDDMFRTLFFEAADIPPGFSGIPQDIYDSLAAENKKLNDEVSKNREKSSALLANSREELCKICNLAKKRSEITQIKKKAIHSRLMFFIVGWMDEKSAAKLEKEIAASDGSALIYRERPQEADEIEPPTKLKNNFIFKPFEMFVKMYGMPRYGELDPTPILAITYILFFGIMFGDVGQSLILSIAGFIVYKVKKWDLGGIVGFVGISGVIFGFVYGSVFGNEEILPMMFNTMHLNPMEEIGLMLGGTIVIGMVVIVLGMFLNVIRLIKERNIGECICSHNGIAGIVFYLSVLALAAGMLLDLQIPGVVFVALIIVSLAVMFLSEPLSRLINGEKKFRIKGGMFFVESFFELFEVILSFFSNTISFLRIGAFAIVHVGMMTVVAVLSAGGGAGGIAVQVIGNVLVMCLEGLIVGIQVLRLEYYEMFSRYFVGGGKEFVSLKEK